MADRHDSIDLRTLEKVQRLLATTDFASIDDLAGRTGGPDRPADAIDLVDAGASASTGPAAGFEPAGPAPLPRRR